MNLVCQYCGKTFQAKRNDAKYCSSNCRNMASRKNRGLVGKICLICGEKFSPLTKSANKRKFCYNCLPNGEIMTRGRFSELLKTKKYGGKCVRCGYNTYVGALEFHHIDPSTKDTIIAADNITYEKAIEEAQKCILLCANCHKEFHGGLWSLSELNFKEGEEVVGLE